MSLKEFHSYDKTCHFFNSSEQSDTKYIGEEYENTFAPALNHLNLFNSTIELVLNKLVQVPELLKHISEAFHLDSSA